MVGVAFNVIHHDNRWHELRHNDEDRETGHEQYDILGERT